MMRFEHLPVELVEFCPHHLDKVLQEAREEL